jgi:hypothetical protein
VLSYKGLFGKDLQNDLLFKFFNFFDRQIIFLQIGGREHGRGVYCAVQWTKGSVVQISPQAAFK